MKKLLNRSGMTLVEVIVAAVILAIIAAPILDSLLEVFKTNVKSDLEIKMNNAIHEAAEIVKARGYIGEYDDVGAGKYYDALFNSVSDSAPNRRYKLTVGKPVNKIDTVKDYDRWDYIIKIKKETSSDANITIYENKWEPDSSIMEGNSPRGKLYKAEKVNIPDLIGNNFTFDFIGRLIQYVDTDSYRLSYKIGNTTGSLPDFTPGKGYQGTISGINYNWTGYVEENNQIVVNIEREFNPTDPTTEPPPVTLTIGNKTFYNRFDADLYISGGKLAYYRNLVVNIFNEDVNNPKIDINTSTQYVSVNKTKAKLDEAFKISNGSELVVKIEDISTPTPSIVKSVTSVAGKDVKLAP